MGKSSDDFEDTKVVKKAKIQKKSKKTMGDSSDDFEDTKVVKKAKKLKSQKRKMSRLRIMPMNGNRAITKETKKQPLMI